MKDEALKLALDDLIAEYHMETSSFAKRVDEIFKQALAAQPAPVHGPSLTDLAGAIEYADARWSGVDVPIEWARHFADAIGKPCTTPPARPAVPEGIKLVPVAEVGGGKTFQDLDWLENPPQLDNGTVLYVMLAAHGITKGQP
jgi:hypothetical protein